MWKNKILPVLILAALIGAPVVGFADTEMGKSTGQYVDDATITTKVKSAIVGDAGLSGFDINVKTYQGLVQLSGFVNSQKIADLAVADARTVAGVKEVINSLLMEETTSTKGYVDDSTLTTKVKSAILSDSGLSGLDINVKTNHGVVQLSGFVANQSLIEQAVNKARKVEGTRSVVNSLLIK